MDHHENGTSLHGAARLLETSPYSRSENEDDKDDHKMMEPPNEDGNRNGIVIFATSHDEEDNPFVPTSTLEDTHVEMVPMSVGGWSNNGRKQPQHKDDLLFVDDDDDHSNDRPSNEKLLSTAFLSFMGFTICQTVAAFVAGSEAMMGDSAAMFVDALTYLFNLVAERRKSRFDEFYHIPASVRPERVHHYKRIAKRKMTLHMELVPPLLSVTTLLVVTAFVSQKAIRVLILDVHRSRSEQGDPNVNLMLFFSVMNLVLDGVNVFCFAKAQRLMGFKTTEDHNVAGSLHNTAQQYEQVSEHDDDDENDMVQASDDPLEERGVKGKDATKLSESGKATPAREKEEPTIDWQLKVLKTAAVAKNGDALPESSRDEITSSNDLDSSDDSQQEDGREGPNLNMCSAYTHVFADTLRSIAVVVASMTAELVEGVTPEEADATAAVIVSALILLSLIPLFHGLFHTFSELRAIRAEEASELTMMPSKEGIENRGAELT